MRIACSPLVLAACSSPARPATPHSTESPADATTASAAPHDADTSPCVPFGSDLYGYVDGAMILCASTSDEIDAMDTCIGVQADGGVEPAPDPRRWYPSASPIGSVGHNPGAEVCTAEDACVQLRPKLESDESIWGMAVDAQGQRAVLGISVKDRVRPSAIEVWDVATQARIARATLRGAVDEVAFFGDTIFASYHGDPSGATMFRLGGKTPKLSVNAEIDHQVWDTAMVGPDHVAFVSVDPPEIEIRDVITGEALGKSSWTSLVGDAYRLGRDAGAPWYQIAGAGDAVALYVSDKSEAYFGAGVVTPITGGNPRPFAFRLCPDGT